MTAHKLIAALVGATAVLVAACSSPAGGTRASAKRPAGPTNGGGGGAPVAVTGDSQLAACKVIKLADAQAHASRR